MRLNDVYCFAFHLKTMSVSCFLNSSSKTPLCGHPYHVSYYLKKKKFKQALIGADSSDKREQRPWRGVCGGHFQELSLRVLIVAQRKRIQLETMRLPVRSLVSLSGLRIWRCLSCGVGRRCDWDLGLLWLWCRPAAVALTQPLAWEPPYAMGAALKRKKKKGLEGEWRQWSLDRKNFFSAF